MISFFNGRKCSLGGETSKVYAQLSVDFRNYLHHFKGAKLSVLLSIALHANEDGWSWPSRKRIVEETGYCTDAVGRALNQLCTMEIDGQRVLLRYQPRREEGGVFASNRYLIFPNAAEVAEYEGTGIMHLGSNTGGGFTGEPSRKNADAVRDRNRRMPAGRHDKMPRRTRTIEQEPIDEDDDLMTEQQMALNDLLSLGVDPATAQELAESCDPDRVIAWVAYAKSRARNLRNPAGLVVARLREGAPVPTSERAGNDRRRFIEGEFADWIQR